MLALNLDAQIPSLLKDINPTGNSNYFSYKFTSLQNKTVFQAYNGLTNGLWISDGTTTGTEQFYTFNNNIFGNPTYADLIRSVELNNKLYFLLDDDLFETDGTTSGTQASFVIDPTQKVYSLAKYSNQLLVVTYTPNSFPTVHKLWALDVSTGNTILLSTGGPIEISPKGLFNNFMYFTQVNSNGFNELWESDGTASGTVLISANNIDVDWINGEFNGELYFTATVSNVFYVDRELFCLTAGGFVQQLSNFPDENFDTWGSGPIGDIYELNSKLYMLCQDNTLGLELFVYQNGSFTPLDLLPGLNSSNPSLLTIFNNKLYFTASDFIQNKFYMLDPASDYITEITSPANFNLPQKLKVYNGQLYLSYFDLSGVGYLYAMDSFNTMNLIFLNGFSTLNYGSELEVSNNVLYLTCLNQANGSDIEPFSLDNYNIKWTGNTSSSWYDPSNWEPQQIPTENDNILIGSGKQHYPLIASSNAKCNAIKIEIGGNLNMTGGTLNVYGEITAANANMFDLSGGTLVLYHGSLFPVGMEFNNLTLKSINNLLSGNTYEFTEDATIHGDLKLYGTATGNATNVPNIKMEEGDEISLKKNLIVDQGHIGINANLLPLTNNYLIPALRFTGTVSQTMKFNNNVSANISGLSCDVEIVNPLVKIINTNRDIIFNNLYIFENFNLAGSSLIIAGKIIYQDNELTTKKITNTKPLSGRLSVYNDPAFCANQDFQFISLDKLRYFDYNGFNSSAIDTVFLLKDLIVDTLKVNGYLSMGGRNVTIGSTTTATGLLDCDLISAGIAQGTLSLLGNISHPPYELVAENLNNFKLNNPAGVKLNNEFDLPFAHESTGKMELFGNAKLLSGSFDMRKSRIFLVESPISSSGNQGRVTETPGNTFRNSEVITGLDAFSISKDTTVVTPVSNLNIGNLGFIITCNNPLNNIQIYRVPEQTAGLNGNASINRVYFVSNSSGGIGLNALIKLKYDESELIVNESDLAIFRRSMNEPAGVWQLIPSTVNTITNTVTANSGLSQLDYSTTLPVGFTFYTLASTTFPLRNENELTNQSESNTSKVLVYPNPFSKNMNAQFQSETAESATMQLIDLNGKIMHSETIQLAIGTNDINLCCTEKINAGIYFLRITSSIINSIVKVVKD